MPKKTSYSVVRCPEKDWENIMDAATLEGGNRDDVWDALENLEYFSNPWLVVKISGGKASAKIFSNQESAQKYLEKMNNRLSVNEKALCIKGEYR